MFRKKHHLCIFVLMCYILTCSTFAEEVNQNVTDTSSSSPVATDTSNSTTQQNPSTFISSPQSTSSVTPPNTSNSSTARVSESSNSTTKLVSSPPSTSSVSLTATSNTSDPNPLPAPSTTNSVSSTVRASTSGNVTGDTATSNVTATLTSTENSTTPGALLPTNVLSIFFVNDMRYDIFPVRSDNGRVCNRQDNVTDCIGGVGRLSNYIRNKMKANPHSLWLNAGNTLGGEWFKFLKYKTAIEAIKFLNFTSVALGPDVFQYGKEASAMFLEELDYNILVSNIDMPNVTRTREYSTGTCDIALIGFVDDTNIENNTYGVTSKNLTEAILKGINETNSRHISSSHLITIALGSTVRDKAIAIAKATDAIDIILYSGNCTPSGTEDNSTQYFCLDSVNNTRIYSLAMNHTDMAARFLVGELQVTMADDCTISNIRFSYHDYSNETDDPSVSNITNIDGFADVDKKLTENTKNLSAESQTCYHAECSLGELIADSMLQGLEQNIWNENGSQLAVFPAVMLQENKTIPTGNITTAQLYSLVKQDAYIYTVALTSHQLSEMVKVSLNGNHQTNSTAFLHISSLLNVKYNKTYENGFNLISINTVLHSSDSMNLQAIDMKDNTTLHKVAVPYTLFQMDSYRELLESVNSSRISFHDVTVIEALIKAVNNTWFMPLPAVGSRLQQLNNVEIEPLPECPSSTGTTILVTLVVTALILGVCYGIWWYMIRRRRGRSGSSLGMMNLEYTST